MKKKTACKHGLRLLSLALLPLLLAAACKRRETASREENSAAAAADAPPQTPIDPATAGQIVGLALFEGEPPAPVRVIMNPVCAQTNGQPAFREDVVVNGNKTLRNVFVYVKQGLDNRHFDVPAQPAVLDQKGCRFQPHVLGLMAGQKLEVKNSDNLSHNVHAMARQNREWNESLPASATELVDRFAHPEIMIALRCNIHKWMNAYVGVVSNPFFAVTDDKGGFTLKGLPPGNYTVEAWQEKLGVQDLQVTVRPKEVKMIQFKFKG